jgi:sterol desaturase/sphingolipid hydroxylase (fatty acid hydroxylase superfamily)
MDIAPLIDEYLELWPSVLRADLVRYLIGAGGIFLTIWLVLRQPLARRKIRVETPPTRQMWSEFGHSMLTVAIFAGVGTGIALGKLHGVLPIYTNVAEHGWAYFAASLLLMIVAHDAYFYWAHRLMHRWRWLWRFHATHHRSRNPTPWAAYSFDPGEALIHAMFMPVFVAVFPMHFVALFLFTAHMMLRNAIGHCGYELCPRGWARHPMLGQVTTTTHHDIHHEHGSRNFGLYFTWWDRWMETEHPDFHRRFDEVTARVSSPTGGATQVFERRQQMKPLGLLREPCDRRAPSSAISTRRFTSDMGPAPPRSDHAPDPRCQPAALSPAAGGEADVPSR